MAVQTLHLFSRPYVKAHLPWKGSIGTGVLQMLLTLATTTPFILEHVKLLTEKLRAVFGFPGTLQVTWLSTLGEAAATKVHVRPRTQGRGPLTGLSLQARRYLHVGTRAAQSTCSNGRTRTEVGLKGGPFIWRKCSKHRFTTLKVRAYIGTAAPQAHIIPDYLKHQGLWLVACLAACTGLHAP